MAIARQMALEMRDGSSVRAVVGQAAEERGSRFVAALLFPVKDQRHGAEAVALLRNLRDFDGATHKIAAFRAANKEDFLDDDGEDRAGSRLRGTLKKEKALGVAVVVARWYGGVNIGKARFNHVAERCKLLLKAIGQKPDEAMTAAFWGVVGNGRALGSGQGDGEKETRKRVALEMSSSSSDAGLSVQLPHEELRKQRRLLFIQAFERRNANLEGDTSNDEQKPKESTSTPRSETKAAVSQPQANVKTKSSQPAPDEVIDLT